MGSYVSPGSIQTLQFGMDQTGVPEGTDLEDTHGGKSTDPGAINVLSGSIELVLVSGAVTNAGGDDTIGITIRTINANGVTAEIVTYDASPKSAETFEVEDFVPMNVEPGWYVHISTSAGSKGGVATIDNPRVILAIEGTL